MLLPTETIRAEWKVGSTSEANQAAWAYTLERTPVAGRTRDFHHAVPAAGPSCHSQRSELGRKKSLVDVTWALWEDCMETASFSRGTNPEALRGWSQQAPIACILQGPLY